jgi:radical SAM protein with 4Fe4S-binding SPASM domain
LILSDVKYLRYLFLKKYPAEITFFITASCNFRCKHCFNWEKIEKGNYKGELSIDEIEKITKTIPPFLRLSVSGGEPFLRPDLAQICKTFYENCGVKFITIPTNASLPEKIVKDIEQILKLSPDLFLNISLSLDGLGKKRDYIVGKDNTNISLLKTAQEIKKLQKRFSNLGLGVITTQTFANENQLEEIYEYAKNEMGADNFGFNIARMDPEDKKEAQPDWEIYKKFAHKLSREERSSTFKFPLSSIFTAKKNLVFRQMLKAHQERRYLNPCFSGKLRVVIDEQGNVYPCETLQYCFDNGKYLMGNLRDHNYDFNQLFFSVRAEKIKDNIKRTKCFCSHECDMETNILFNKYFVPRLLYEALKISFKK